MVHKLITGLKAEPLNQKTRHFAADESKAMLEEVNKLLDVGFIRECY